MHTIEPYYRWRDYYIASEDKYSPFYDREYNEFEYVDQIYNYVIHPQWDYFGSKTLYLKILYVDYIEGYTFIQLMGEWNDSIENDIMLLKRNILEILINQGVKKIFFIGDNLMNLFYDEDDYYEELAEELHEARGYIFFINFPAHLVQEINGTAFKREFYFEEVVNWRRFKPDDLYRKFTNKLSIGTSQTA